MKYDIIIVGAGIVGLATAFKLKRKAPGLTILILEKESKVGQHQTGHNSGVIHSGLYYQPGSLKARNCIKGYGELLEFCDQYHVPYEICGKLVVATRKQELPLLENLRQRGNQNGLQGIKHIPGGQLKEYEPHVNGLAGLWVPQTGIIDYLQVALKLAQWLTSEGVEIEFNRKVTSISHNGSTIIKSGENAYTTRWVVNCAGLYSDRIAAMTQTGLPYRILPFRGEYYKLKPERRDLVKNLIYPVPDPSFPFLGVHFTRMMDGAVEAGPNAVLAFSREGYHKTDVVPKDLVQTLLWPGFQRIAYKYWQTGLGEMYRSFSKSAFTKALQALIPEITEKDLVPAGSGVRAQASDRDGGLIDDFLIIENSSGIHVGNAPSPAATSSLAIGGTVADLLLKRMD